MKIYLKEETPSINLEDRIDKIIRMSETLYPPGISTSVIEAEGDMIVGLSAGVGMRLPVPGSGSGQYVGFDPTVSGKIRYYSVDITLRDIRNLLNNGGFAVAQRGTSFTAASTFPNNDDVYLLDQWILLSDGNDIVDISQNALTAEQNPYYMRALVATANKKFGLFQPLENKNSPMEGEAVSLSIRARTTGAPIRNMRAAVLSWDGTADSITSDVVSAWNAESTNPGLVANWTYENTPSDLELSTDWQTFSIEGVSIDTSGVNNVGVFIWCDDGDAAVNDVLDIQWVKLERGNVASGYTPIRYNDEIRNCSRYVQKSFPYNTVPVQAVGSNIGTLRFVAARAGAAAEYSQSHPFPVVMRTTPTFTLYNPINANAEVHDLSVGLDCSASSAAGISNENYIAINCTGNASTAVGDYLFVHWFATAEL